MLYIPITNHTLQKAAADAISRNEVGILIWSTGSRLINLHDKTTNENPVYQAMMSEVQKGDIIFVDFEKGKWRSINGSLESEELSISMQSGVNFRELAVPARAVASDGDYCERITQICNRFLLSGPITTFPSGHLSSIHFNPSILKWLGEKRWS